MWTTALVILIAGGFLLWRAAKRAQGLPLLKVTTTTPDGYAYSVHYEDLHPQVQNVERIWLLLLFPAKMLFTIGRDPKQHEEKLRFLKSLRNLGNEPWENALGIFDCADTTITLSSKPIQGKTITAQLGFKSSTSRTMRTKIPGTWYDTQMHDSWIAMLATSSLVLDERELRFLKIAFRHMSEAYETADTASIMTLINVPHAAFVNAVMEV